MTETARPTIGRVVHYYGPLAAWPGMASHDEFKNYKGPFAATVVFVHEDGAVNLRVDYPTAITKHFGENLTMLDLSRTSELAAYVINDPQSDRRWEWPPRA